MKWREKNKCYKNFRKFLDIIKPHSIQLSDFLIETPLYINGMCEHISLIERTALKDGKILDLGCGSGHLAMQLSTLGFHINGIDINDEHYGELNAVFSKRKELQDKIWKLLEEKFDVKFNFYKNRFPYENDSFNAVVAYAVIEHVSDLDQLLCEIKRVLLPGGYLFIFRTPRHKAIGERIARILRLGYHNTLINDKKLISKLENLSFNILLSKETDLFPTTLPVFQKFYELLSPFLSIVDILLLKTPLKHFAHNILIVAQKIEERK